MGTTIEFYVVDLDELNELLAIENEDDMFFDQLFGLLETYPVADFSFHLVIPDDMDSLCVALHQQTSLIPRVFRDLLVKQLWYDGSSASLTLLADYFVTALNGLNANKIEQAALD